MEFRYSRDSDLASIDKIWNEGYSEEFGLPDLSNTIMNGVVEEGSKILAFGMVKIFAEGIFIVDPNLSKRDKISAIREIMLAQKVAAYKGNLKQLHAFCQNDKFADILKKHFGYRDTQGKCVVYEAESSNG